MFTSVYFYIINSVVYLLIFEENSSWVIFIWLLWYILSKLSMNCCYYSSLISFFFNYKLCFDYFRIVMYIFSLMLCFFISNVSFSAYLIIYESILFSVNYSFKRTSYSSIISFFPIFSTLYIFYQLLISLPILFCFDRKTSFYTLKYEYFQ